MFSRRVRLMAELLRENQRPIWTSMFSTILTVFIGFATPMLLAETIDAVIDQKPLHAPAFIVAWFERIGGRAFVVENLWIVAGVLVLLSLINGVFQYVKGRTSAQASETVALTLRERLYDHLQRMTYAEQVRTETGDLIQRCTSDVDTIRRFLAMQLTEIVNAVIMLVLAAFLLLQRHVPLTLLSFVLMPIQLVFALVFFQRVSKHFRIMDEAEGQMSAVLQENLTAVRVVRAFGRQQFEVEKFDAASRDFRDKANRLMRHFATYWSVSDLISFLQSGITLLFGVWYASSGELTVGTLTLFLGYVNMMLWPIRRLGRILADASKSLVSLERIDEVLRRPAEREEPDALTPDLNRDIVFDGVRFAYDGQPPVLDGVSFTVRQGQTVAILGATGSGKTTLMHLLQRLYEPAGGSITIGGVDLRNIQKRWLRSRVGLVLQEPFLYSKTIRENIGIARGDLTQEDIARAARLAQAETFIEEAEKGWETLVGERGVTLSGGQKQRVAIARTLLKENDVLIFDDSLSAVDTQTDAAIRKALKEERKGVTTFIISHRIPTLSEADFIVVLDKGRVVQQGSHAELIQQPGLYRCIYEIQSLLESELEEDQQEGIAHAIS